MKTLSKVLAISQKVLTELFVLLLFLYKAMISPFLGGGCRFLPSCSAYAREALQKHGLCRGTWLAIRRLLRCRPCGGSGYDPVPPSLATKERSALRHKQLTKSEIDTRT